MALLSIVLPAYNEEQNIANTVKVLSELLDEKGIEYELVFISDGSGDGTFREIQKAAAENPRVTSGKSRPFLLDCPWQAGTRLWLWTATCSILRRLY